MFEIEKNKDRLYNHKNKKTKFGFKFNKKYFIILITIILAFLLILYSIHINNSANFNSIKKNKNKNLIYTKYTKTVNKITTKVPYINVDVTAVDNINNSIDLAVNKYLKNENNNITYEYSLSGKILSVLLRIVEYDTKNIPNVIFESYNINLNTLKLVTKEDLYNLFEVNNNIINKKIEAHFQKLYNDSSAAGYVDNRLCDYNCFLKWRGVVDYFEGVSYYIKDGKLYAFKPFDTYSMFGEEEFFKENDFKIYVSG